MRKLIVLSMILLSCSSKEALNQTNANGERIGKWLELDDKGDTIRYEIYDSRGTLEYEITKVTDGRKIESFYSEGQLYRQKYYFRNGNLESDTEYSGGVQNGYQVAYYENGEKRIETKWDNGEVRGRFVQYHQNGQINFEAETFGNGELNVYDSLGNLLKIYIYKDHAVVDSLDVK